jgi:hypothetical protein
MGYINGRVKVLAKTIVPGTTGEATYTEIVGLIPKNSYVLREFGRVITAFTGLTKPLVSLGVTGDTDRYMVAQPIDAINEFIFGAPAKSNSAITGVKDFCAKMDKNKITSSAQPIIATFTSSSTTFDPTAGEVEFVIVYVTCN